MYKWAFCEKNGVKISTSVLVGSVRSLKSNIYDNIVIVLDGYPSRSKKILPSYKGTRVKDETFVSLGIPKLETVQFLTKIGERIGKNVSVVCSPMQETDEVISSLVHHISGNLPSKASFISKLNQRSLLDDKMLSSLQPGVETSLFIPSEGTSIISTTDGDFIQLQRFDNVYIDKSTSGKEVTNTWTSASTHSLNPYATIIYKSIYGDVGDNIPPICPTDKEVLRDISKINSIEDVRLLRESVDSEVKLPKRLEYLYKSIIHHRTQFIINYEVAFLKFISYPIKLSYPEYRIEDTIEKYNLKV